MTVVANPGRTGIKTSPVLLAASAVAVSLTGTTAETALATITLPALGPNDGIEIRTVWSNNSSAGTKTFRTRLGGAAGTVYASGQNTTAVTYADERRIRNRGATNSQIGHFSTVAAPIGQSTLSIVASAVETGAPVDLVLSAQLGSGADSGTLEAYEVWLLPGA